MEKSKALARANWKGSGDKSLEEKWFKIREELNPTEFLGYEFNKTEGVVLKISKGKEFIEEAKEGDSVELITNQTPFYAESGGQVGDQGVIKTSTGKINVLDTQKKMGDLHVHVGKVSKGSIKVGDNVNLEIDVKRRKDAKAYHSATHLLHEALRRTLGKHVTQKGSLVSPEKLRFDFSHNKPIEKSEITKIENLVNDMVSNSSDVKTRIMTPKEAVDNGALALFGEKYGDEVRVLSMGHENKKYFSTELCGGTHVANTAEIGKFKIISQSSIASGVRRVAALRADQLEEYEKNQKESKSTQENLLIEEIKNVKNAGSIFIGKFSPEAMGDYLAGPNHVLPTSGSARFSSGLSVNDFLKRHSLIKITKTGIERLSASVINLAMHENLEGHANSIKIRLKKDI